MQDSISTSSFEARLLLAANRNAQHLARWIYLPLCLPGLWLGYGYASNTLGTNPLERLVREPGKWGMILLLLVLTITPARNLLPRCGRRCKWRWGKRLADWNWLIRLRRPIGIASFLYMLAHTVIYLALDLDWAWDDLISDLRSKPFLAAGLASFLLLIPLAITSTDGWVRRLKRNWKRLHMLIYPASVLAILHYFWLSKPGQQAVYVYTILLALLLAYRGVLWCRRSLSQSERLGEEAPERMAAPRLPEQ